MSHNILVINCGSSSIKFALVNEDSDEFLLSGLAERLGTDEAEVHIKHNGEKQTLKVEGKNHRAALEKVLPFINDVTSGKLDGIGHRIVHGGENFTKSARVTTEVVEEIRRISPLAPLHNPASLVGLEATVSLYPNVTQVVVFDTSFHQTMPEHAYRYAIPEELYTKHFIRRYGFHGTSHRFVSKKGADSLGLDYGSSSFIVAHLGNGCSTCAVENGKSVDTSMGLTPLEGVAMGTRSGDVDPNLHGYLIHTLGWSLEQVEEMLNKQSGVLGLSGISNDMRTLEAAYEQNNKNAILAVEVFCYRVAKSIASMGCALSKLDALLFTGGIGENSSFCRSKIVEHLKVFGFRMDQELNVIHADDARVISTSDSIRIVVVPTNEEKQIALDTLSFI